MTVGVTGGTGSGKSEVCRVFQAAGARVIDADAVGHETLAEPDVARRLADAFGADILDAEGRVIRRRLGQRSFASEAARKRLTDVVWPRIAAQIRERIARIRAAEPGRTVVLDAPLLIEWDDPKAFCDRLVVVTAPEAVRVRRTAARLGIAEAEVRARMAFQLPDHEKAAHADYVIENTATLPELQAQARCLWRRIHQDTTGENRS